jgi:hypothetical protein
VLQVLAGCDTCEEADELKRRRKYVEIDGRRMCAACWHRLGEPRSASAPTAIEAALVEAKTRERMLARGGADRHLARSGKA